MLAQQSSQHQIQDQAEETVVRAENKVDSLIEHRQLLTRHLITTLIALNEVNKELENVLLSKTAAGMCFYVEIEKKETSKRYSNAIYHNE